MGRQPCCDKVGLKKGPWAAEEDQKLVSFLLANGHCCWRVVPKLAGLLRCGKSCRLRWTNYLRPDLKRGLLEEEEEKVIIDLHAKLGNRWSKIAAQLPGRTDNEIKNHWNTHIKKKLKKMGIDPVTHQQLPPLPPLLQEPPPQLQVQQHGGDGLAWSSQAAACSDEEVEVPVIEPREVATVSVPMVATGSCSVSSGSASAAASVVSPSCSSSSASALVVSSVDMDWPEPMELFGVDGIMDMDLASFFSDGGGNGNGGISLDPFYNYPCSSFDQQDWM